MSLRRFAGYFFALSACSTLAFASSTVGQTLPPQSEPAYSAAPFASHHRRPALPHPFRHGLRPITLLAGRH